MFATNFYKNYKSYIHSFSWIMMEKLIGMSVGLLVIVAVARYLGPQQFGIIAYATSLVAIMAMLGHMGLSGIVIRELVKRPEDSNTILGTVIFLKSVGYGIGFLLTIIYIYFSEPTNNMEFWVCIIIAATLLTKPVEVVDLLLQAQTKFKYISISKISAILITTILKAITITSGLSLVYFALADLAQALLFAFFLIIILKRNTLFQAAQWDFKKNYARKLLSEGAFIYAGSILAIIYLKIDQVMLKWLVGSEEVGIYAVAAQFSEIWYFLPTAIVASTFPKLVEIKEKKPKLFKKKIQQLFNLLLVFSLITSVIFTLFSEPFFFILFGKDYHDSASILIIHIWASIFIFMRALFSKWILIENTPIYSLKTQGIGAVLNVFLNLLLIPHYQGHGAAIATVISYAGASYLSLAFYKRTRPVFWMMSKSLLCPITIPLKKIRTNYALYNSK